MLWFFFSTKREKKSPDYQHGKGGQKLAWCRKIFFAWIVAYENAHLFIL